MGAGLRAREAPAIYSGTVGLTGGGVSSSGGRKCGAGLRVRKHPAMYKHSVGLSGAGMSSSGGAGTHAGAMKNPWISAVKEYQSKHGCSYKEALIGAKTGYKSGRN